MATGICDPNKSWTQEHCSLKVGTKLKYLKMILTYFLTGDITVAVAPATQVSFKIAHHLLNVSQKLMEQQQMMLKI